MFLKANIWGGKVSTTEHQPRWFFLIHIFKRNVQIWVSVNAFLGSIQLFEVVSSTCKIAVIFLWVVGERALGYAAAGHPKGHYLHSKCPCCLLFPDGKATKVYLFDMKVSWRTNLIYLFTLPRRNLFFWVFCTHLRIKKNAHNCFSNNGTIFQRTI